MCPLLLLCLFLFSVYYLFIYLCIFAGGEEVVDLGTGSGVLAVAAAVLGAKHVVAVDIDVEILIHARQNFLVRS